MAEIFGAVASGAGLVSLSMQLLESAQKLKGFCDPARDAPTTVTRLSSEMETMSLLLRQFESFRRNQIFGDQVLDSCIKSCEEAVSKIKDSVGRVERLLLVPKTRSLGKTYMGFKEPKIRKLLEEMEHAKSSVLLAFSSYHHHHSILRDARHEDLLLQQFAAQNERLGSLEREVASGNFALLKRTQAPQSQQLLEAPELQQLVHAARPIGPQRLALGLNDDKRHNTFDERRKRTWLWKSRVSLPLWLVNRVWEFGLREAEGGWTAQLYPIMVRPHNTYVFDFVLSGDVDTVLRLLRAGQLSVRDHIQHKGTLKNLLQVSVVYLPLQLRSTNSTRLAASRGQIELCRFLLQESRFFCDDEILLAAFNEHVAYIVWDLYAHEWSQRRKLVEGSYRLFVSENNMNVDFKDGHPYGSFPSSTTEDWKLLLSVSSVRDILNGQRVNFDSLPFEQRFSTAISSTGWPAETFLSIFRHDNPASLITAVNSRGTTALHWAAAHLGAWVMRGLEGRSHGNCADEVESYQTLVKELIRMGANLHAIHQVEQVEAEAERYTHPSLVRADPFVSFLRGLSKRVFDQKNVASAVRLWGQTLAASGHSLKDYADAENLYLADLGYVISSTDCQQYFQVSVAVRDDSILQTKVVDVHYINFWRAHPTKTPGAWPVRLGLPDTIIWWPQEDDVKDGVQWVQMDDLELEATPRTAQLPGEADMALLVNDRLREARAKWFNGVQDDHGPLAMMVARGSKYKSHAHRQHVRRRSASAQPPCSFEHVVAVKQKTKDSQTPGPGSLEWATYVNKCPLDGRWGACGSIASTSQWRWCMRGDLHNTPDAETDAFFPHPWNWRDSWKRPLLNDKLHTGVAERFAKRFWPELLHFVQTVVRRAEEKKALKLEEEVHTGHQ